MNVRYRWDFVLYKDIVLVKRPLLSCRPRFVVVSLEPTILSLVESITNSPLVTDDTNNMVEKLREIVLPSLNCYLYLLSRDISCILRT